MTDFPSDAAALLLVAQASFRPFDRHDHDLFSGCRSDQPPLIHYADKVGEHFTLILDGPNLTLVDPVGEECTYYLTMR